MNPKRLSRAAVLASVAVLAAACGSSNNNSSTTSGSSGSSSSSSAGVARASAVVASLSKPTTSFPAPGPALKNVKSLKGKSVWYIPISLQAPVFGIANSSLRTALGKVGVTVHSCSANSNPSGAAACVNEAVARGAGAIIADALPVVLAANAFASAESHHIPVLIANQLPPPSPKMPGAVMGNGTDKLAYALSQDVTQVKAIADWTIADSHGKANTLMEVFTDSPSTVAYGAGGVAEFKHNCPSCKITVQKIALANASLIPSQTSSALLRDHGINYVIPEFDAVLQPVSQGIQQTGAAPGKIKVGTDGGDLPALQQLKAGRLGAEVGEDFPYAGWAEADEVMRMMLHMPVVVEHVPLRMFTASNIGSVQLTPAAQASGAWYGGSAYQTMFEHLWGVS